MSPDPPLPADWEDVTPAWMTVVLADRFPGIEVVAAELVWRSDGSNRRARFALTCAGREGPAMVFVKAEGAHREVHARNGNLFNEAKLLRGCTPLPIEHAQPLAVLIDEPRLDWLIILEDVTGRGADPRDATRPVTPAQATSGVRGLAGLHRTHWGLSPTPGDALDWLQTWAPTEGFQLGLRRCVPLGLERACSAGPFDVADWSTEQVVDTWVRYVSLLDRDPVTLLHGDAHIGNTYVLPGDAMGFLDWQVARRGGWSQDVGYFVQGALVPADRRANEAALLDAYRSELDRSLGREEAWLWYRASAVYGLAIWLSTLGTDGYQSREVSLTLARRYATTVHELDSLDAIGALERGPGPPFPR